MSQSTNNMTDEQKAEAVKNWFRQNEHYETRKNGSIDNTIKKAIDFQYQEEYVSGNLVDNFSNWFSTYEFEKFKEKNPQIDQGDFVKFGAKMLLDDVKEVINKNTNPEHRFRTSDKFLWQVEIGLQNAQADLSTKYKQYVLDVEKHAIDRDKAAHKQKYQKPKESLLKKITKVFKKAGVKQDHDETKKLTGKELDDAVNKTLEDAGKLIALASKQKKGPKTSKDQVKGTEPSVFDEAEKVRAQALADKKLDHAKDHADALKEIRKDQHTLDKKDRKYSKDKKDIEEIKAKYEAGLKDKEKAEKKQKKATSKSKIKSAGNALHSAVKAAAKAPKQIVKTVSKALKKDRATISK